MHKMFKNSAEIFAENYIRSIMDKEKRNKDIGEKLGIENIYGVIVKETKSKFETKIPTNEQIKKYKGHESELIKGEKFMHTRENITKTIMHCRVSTPKAIELPTRLEFNQHDLIMTKEQLVLTKRIKEFASEEILLQHSLSSYKIDLYFPGHKLAIEVDGKGHTDRDVHKEIERQKATEKDLGCEFNRINLDEKDFDLYVEIGKINNQSH